MAKTYPVSLVLADKAVLVVGGGEVATRKVKGLLDSGARITVVSPQVAPELMQLIEQGVCLWLEKTYEPTDLEGIKLVFACTSDEELNARISEDATARHLLVNVADRPELCSFYLPSVFRRDKLSVAISTEGSSPAAARRIRKDLEEYLDEEIGLYLQLMQAWRKKVIETLSPEKRRLFWQKVEEEQIYELITCGQSEQAKAKLSQIFEESS